MAATLPAASEDMAARPAVPRAPRLLEKLLIWFLAPVSVAVRLLSIFPAILMASSSSFCFAIPRFSSSLRPLGHFFRRARSSSSATSLFSSKNSRTGIFR